MSKTRLCPISEINWDEIFHQSQRPGSNEPDPEGELLGIDLLVSRYRAGYPDKARKDWVEARLRSWWRGQTE